MIITIRLCNCYGIPYLEQEFDFRQRTAYAVYASNGVMKTSFAKTLHDHMENEDSKDEIFTKVKSVREVSLDGGDPLAPASVLAIKSLHNINWDSISGHVAPLLLSRKLKAEYDGVNKKVEEKKSEFFTLLSQMSGIKDKLFIELEICKIFAAGKPDLQQALNRVKDEVGSEDSPYKAIEYKRIFNPKTEPLFEKAEFTKRIEEYVNRFNELLELSRFFKKGSFNHTNAETIASELEKNNFFHAEHLIQLKDKSGDLCLVNTKQELIDIINAEKDRILQDAELKTLFEGIDKQLKKNSDLRDLREYLAANQTVVQELVNPKLLKENLWKSYFIENKILFQELLSLLKDVADEIKRIENKAKAELSDWEAVIREFNSRFDVPYKLVVGNEFKARMGYEKPVIGYKYYTDGSKTDTVSVDKSIMERVLSQGEKRALYFLDIMFEIQNRKNQGQQTLLVADDIADSFDYKNKYAIIEYLHEISQLGNFKMILLTHNYDFHRTVVRRLGINRDAVLTATRLSDKVTLQEELYRHNPMDHWRKNLHNIPFLLASIPMVRNLAEYAGKNSEYADLTGFLHMKEKTTASTINDLKRLFAGILNQHVADKIGDNSQSYLAALRDACESIVENGENEGDLKLEEKVVLSIAIRLRAEQYMQQHVSDFSDIEQNQTFELYKRFKEAHENKKGEIGILTKVNLMTPENIHLNSFMFEPLIDMGGHHLIELYRQVSSLSEEK